MSRFFRVTILNTGGEYTYGSISDKLEIDAMLKNIDNNTVNDYSLYKDLNGNDEYLNGFDHNDIVHAYGPDINGSKIEVVEFSNNRYENKVKTILEYTKIANTQVNEFCEDNPRIIEEYLK